MSHWENTGMSDEWYTPKYIFDALGCRFDMDVAAPVDISQINVPANTYLSDSSLMTEWGGFVWMNPPFGGRNSIAQWLEKLAKHGNGIALTPDRTSAPWWQSAAKKADAILFINGKVKFIRPDGAIGKSPSNGTTLLSYGFKGTEALARAAVNNLGIFVKVKP